MTLLSIRSASGPKPKKGEPTVICIVNVIVRNELLSYTEYIFFCFFSFGQSTLKKFVDKVVIFLLYRIGVRVICAEQQPGKFFSG